MSFNCVANFQKTPSAHLCNNIFQTDFTAFEQKCGGTGGAAQCCPGEAQRLSSLTFGCFQVKAKNAQVLTGPEPSQRSLSSLENEGQDQNGKASTSRGCGCDFSLCVAYFYIRFFFFSASQLVHGLKVRTQILTITVE